MNESYNATDDYQDMLLASIIRHPASFIGYENVLQWGYFTGVQAQLLAKTILDEAKKSGQVPSFTTVGQMMMDKSSRYGDTEQSVEMASYIQKLSSIQIRQSDLDHTVGYVIKFAKEKALIAAATEVAKAVSEKKEMDYSIVEKFQQALSIGTNLDDMGYWLHDDADKIRDKIFGESYGIYTGIELFDNIWKRGWGPGWLIVPLGPPKRMKSTLAINIALNMISPKVGHNVFYYACEINAELAALRAMQNVADMTQDEFYEDNDRFMKGLKEKMSSKIGGNLLFKHFPAGSATINDIRAHARTVINATGILPKCIIIDYAETIKSETSKGVDIYQAQADVYTQARALGSELGCCIVMPDRCNRETVEAAVPSMTSFQGRMQKAGIVDVGIGICVQRDQGVVTSLGTIKAGDLPCHIKRSKSPILVLSHNFATGQDEWKPLLNWFHNGRADSFLRITTDARTPDSKSGRSRGAVTTAEHHFFRPDGTEVCAGDLKVGESISARVYAMSHDQRQVLLGTLMGDGHIRKDGGTVSIKHGMDQEYYLRWKQKAFRTLSTSITKSTLKEGVVGKYKLKSRSALDLLIRGSSDFLRLRTVFYPNGIKIVPRQVLTEISELGLAVWFMDDGHIEKHMDRISLHTNGFTPSDVSLLVEWFSHRWGLTGTVNTDNAIRFNAESSRKIMKLLGSYIQRSDKKRETKLFLCPEIAQGTVRNGAATVTSITSMVYTGQHRDKIDIEVADNHNYYLASGALVHNCATDEEMHGRIWRAFVFLNRHGAAGIHLRGKFDLEKMIMTLDEELEYDELEAMKMEKANKRRGKQDPRLEE